MTPGPPGLRAILERCGVGLAAKPSELLWRYHQLLREADARLNLTRIRNFENMVLKHYVDSLLVLRFEELPSPLLDLGTGPGLPGVPLKLARPDLHLILADTRGPRIEFLREVIETLRLDATEAHSGRITARFVRPIRGVITRAVAPISETLEAVAGSLEAGGRALFMKGPECGDEIEEARAAFGSSHRLVADHAYSIPGTSHRRRLVVYERRDAPTVVEVGAGASSRRSRFAGSAREVTSPSNPHFKQAQEALSGRGIRKHGRALIAGQRLVAEILAREPERAEAWLTDPDGEAPPEGAPAELAWLCLGRELFGELDVAGTRAPLLLIQVPPIPAWSDADPWPPGCTLFVPFQDPENVGACIRSAAAFGAARVVLLRESAHPFHPKAVRVAGPGLLNVPLLTGPPLAELATSVAPLIPLDSRGEELGRSGWPATFGLVAGLEGPGLPERLRSSPLTRRIPIMPGVESLNAATALAVALYDWRRSDAVGCRDTTDRIE